VSLAVELSDNHRRSLSVTCRLVEKAIVEIEAILKGPPVPMLTSHMESTYSDTERRRLLAELQRLKEQNQAMFDGLVLDPETTTDRQIVEAKLNHLWVILEDSKPEHMKGYGTMPQDTAEVVSNHVALLIGTVSQLLRQDITEDQAQK
jgi:hypothetical protein